MSFDRDTKADQVYLISDPDARAKKEAENGVRQIRAAIRMVREYIAQPKRKRKLTSAIVMDLHKEAMDGVHPLAGTFRNTSVTIGTAKHIPCRSSEISDYFAEMIAFVNEHWEDRSALYLAAYVMWRLNWIHPFADGNGRTSRVISYLILSMKLESVLPGTPTIPELIDRDDMMRRRYYDELEKADEHYKHDEAIRIASMEEMMEELLEVQFRSAVRDAGV